MTLGYNQGGRFGDLRDLQRNIDVEFDTGDFFIGTLARPESTRKEVAPQAAPKL